MGVFFLPENPTLPPHGKEPPASHCFRDADGSFFGVPAYSPLRSCSRAASGVLSPLATAVTAS